MHISVLLSWFVVIIIYFFFGGGGILYADCHVLLQIFLKFCCFEANVRPDCRRLLKRVQVIALFDFASVLFSYIIKDDTLSKNSSKASTPVIKEFLVITLSVILVHFTLVLLYF